jgi:precorrin-6B methylase 2
MNLETFRNHAFSRSIELSKHIRNITNGRVYSGPFKDTYISEKFLWGDGDISSKLLGLYEQQLFPYIENIINDAPDLILNIGCAEGYYGVGFAKRLPNSKIIMVDVNEAFNSIINENITNNNLSNVEVVFNSSHDTINRFINQYKKSFVFMDCEGAELYLLDKNYVERLKYVSIIVETHDFSNSTITETLKNRFSNTHNVEVISSVCKNMNIDIIKNLSDVDKMLLWNEWRPCEMQWLYLSAKELL